ncbi:MAG TPA: hypothetical protein VL860_06815, partial [Planctomycetota bacterium]|nr:hypothetical protein [Planctomycetota bacterium]
LPGDLRITVRGTILDDPAKLVGAGGHIGLVTHSPNFRGYASYLIDGYVAEAPCLVEGQTAVKLARNDVDIAYGDWPFTREQTGFEVCLEVLNAHYTLTINGKEVISHTEFVQLPGEFVGLFTYGPAVLIHAVKIESAGMQERVSSLRVVKDLVQTGHSDVAVEMLNGLCTHFAGRELSAKAAFQASLIKIDQGDLTQLEYFKRFILDTVYAPFADLVDYHRALKDDDIEKQADALMRALHRTGAKLARQVALQEACAWEHGHRRLHREVYHRSFVLLAMLERQEWDAESRDRIRDRLIECYTNLDQRLALPYLRELAARPSAAMQKGREELSRPETAAMTLSSWIGLVGDEEIDVNLARTQHLTYHQVLTLPLLGRTAKIRERLEGRPMPQPAAGGRTGLEYFRFSSLGWWREIQALEEMGYNFNTSYASAMAQLLYAGDLEKMADTAPEGCDLRLLALLGRFDAVRQRLRPLDGRLQALQASNHLPEIPSILPALERDEQAKQFWEFHARCYGRGTTHAIAEIMTGVESLDTCRDWRFRWDAINYGVFLGELGLALHLGGRFEEALTIYQELLQSRLSELSPYTWQQQWARRCLKEQGIDAPPLAEPARPDLEPAKFAQLYLGHLGM